jgi:YHS domain-containing protein
MNPSSLASSVFALTLLLAAPSTPVSAADGGNKLCPIMTEDEVDSEEQVTYQGIEISFCCGPCVKQFNGEPDYYAALFKEMKSVPGLVGVQVPGNIKLLEQRYCPLTPTRLVGPASPAVEYKGVKVYLSKPAHVKKWEADPDAHAKAGVAKGLLPQLAGKV